MTPQEEQLLNSLVERINQTQLQEKDPDAEALLNQKLGPNPDSLYILAQTVLVQNIALDQAKAQVTQLQQQLQQQRPQPAHTNSFLGRLLGEHDPTPAQQQAPAYQPVPQFAPAVPQYAQPQYQQPQYVPVGGGQPSFLARGNADGSRCCCWSIGIRRRGVDPAWLWRTWRLRMGWPGDEWRIRSPG